MSVAAVEPIVPGSLRDQIRRGIDEYLRDPLIFPPEFVSWIPQRVEQVGIIVPRSNVTGAYTTADSLSGLGAAVHGRPCMLRVGSSPYHFAQMTYDDVYGKWVSTAVLSASLASLSSAGGTAGVWTNPAEAAAYARPQIPGFKLFYDAGLRPQTTIAAYAPATGGAGTTNSLRPVILEFNTGDTSLNKIAHGGGQLDWAPTVAAWRATASWSDMTFTSTPAESEALLSVQYDLDAGTNFWNISVLMRWVANPV